MIMPQRMPQRMPLLTTKELRCETCGKLLAEKAVKGTVVVCSRCKTRNEVED